MCGTQASQISFKRKKSDFFINLKYEYLLHACKFIYRTYFIVYLTIHDKRVTITQYGTLIKILNIILPTGWAGWLAGSCVRFSVPSISTRHEQCVIGMCTQRD